MKSLIASLIILFAVDASAMRCKTYLVLEGDPIDTVIEKCGTPSVTLTDGNGAVYMFRQGSVYWVVKAVNGIVHDIDVQR